MQILDYYIEKFQKLRSDRNSPWPESSYGRSPYKPLLLLAVIDLFEQGAITTNLIQLTPDLGELFNLYCAIVLPADQKGNIAMPFYHLTGDGFWHLIPLPGQELVIQSGKKLRTVAQLAESVLGAKLDEELYTILCVAKSRNILRAILIEQYFVPNIHVQLMERGNINLEAFQYSQRLLEEAHQRNTLKEQLETDNRYISQARDQGFRRAVVIAYSHRCAFCGIRMLTIDGHTAVDAAHIIPWSESHNDNPNNGIAMCKLCHWSFDEGLLSITSQYAVVTSPQLIAHDNYPGYLSTLQERPIFKPNDELLWPDKSSLAWHRKNKFRKY